MQDSSWWCDDGTRWCWKRLQPWRLINPCHWPVRMHIASVGVSKFCFLLSLAFCGLLLLYIPALQSRARQGDLPLPRPQVKPAQVHPSHLDGVRASSVHAEDADSAERLNRSSAGQGRAIKTELNKNDDHSPIGGTDSRRVLEGGPLPGGKVGQFSGPRDKLDPKDIFIAVKTTRKYHKSRLELLIQTWVSQAKEQVRRPLVIFFVHTL